MTKIFEKANEDGSKIINYTDRIEMYDTNNKLCGILGNLDSYEDLQKKAELADHYKHLYSAVKKQKDDVVVFAKKEKENYLTKACRIADTNNAGLITSAAIYTCDEILRMLGEIDEYQEKEKNI